FEGDLDLVLEVAAALADGLTARGRPAGTPGLAAKDRIKEVGERGALAEEVAHVVFGHGARLIARAARLGGAGADRPLAGGRARVGAILLILVPARPEVVVELALFGIGEHLIGLVDVLEARLGVFVAGVDVGVMLARQLAVRALDLLVGG